MSEIKWIKKREELRELLHDKDKQDWTHRALARSIKMSPDFVAKWRQRLADTALDDREPQKSFTGMHNLI